MTSVLGQFRDLRLCSENNRLFLEKNTTIIQTQVNREFAKHEKAHVLYEIDQKGNHSGHEVEVRQVVALHSLDRVRVVVESLSARGDLQAGHVDALWTVKHPGVADALNLRRTYLSERGSVPAQTLHRVVVLDSLQLRSLVHIVCKHTDSS